MLFLGFLNKGAQPKHVIEYPESLASVHAELPLRIENPITEPGQWKLEAGLTYANTNRSQMTMKEPLLFQTESNQVISVPTDVHQEQRIKLP